MSSLAEVQIQSMVAGRQWIMGERNSHRVALAHALFMCMMEI
jgi:hypothetical protein